MSAFCMCPLIGACGAHVLLLLTAANMLMFLLTCMQTLLVSLDFLVVVRVSSADCLTASRRTLLVWQEVLKGNTSLLKGNTSLLPKAAESQPLQVTFLEQRVGCLLLLTHSCGQQHGFCMLCVHVRLRCCACVIACVSACHCVWHCMCHCVGHCM